MPTLHPVPPHVRRLQPLGVVERGTGGTQIAVDMGYFTRIATMADMARVAMKQKVEMKRTTHMTHNKPITLYLSPPPL